MRIGSLVLAAIAVLTPTSTFAQAVTGKISFTGYDQSVNSFSVADATGLNFADVTGSTVTGTSGTLSGFGAGQGSFAALGDCGSLTGCGTIQDISNFSSTTPISNFLTLLTGGPGVSFDLTGITNVTRVGGVALFLTGTGVINFSGYDPTPGTFTLNTQAFGTTSFSGSITANPLTPAVPEPATWAMMLLGFGGIGFAMRRKRSLALAQIA